MLYCGWTKARTSSTPGGCSGILNLPTFHLEHDSGMYGVESENKPKPESKNIDCLGFGADFKIDCSVWGT
ncbi:hypothetical protein SAMN02746065_107106 [Desulfocicer vacuolatum DSM 3385]|uniref:Uncharacterized protein n=1 Tax=Desulfocicer vacuolatum DSM 3385 TaxID=1121400 RepID=A0A1W2B889_9BACT|nr:hypothetical protein SAMN02746065_107106 [Desulfocicer vacuolatum DSM 3385]